MQISIVGRQIDLTEDLQDYARKRLSKLEKYFMHGPVDIHVALYAQRHIQNADVTIMGAGFTVHAEEQGETLQAAIDLVVDKLDVQLRRHKDRIIRQHQKQRIPEKHLGMNISVFDRDELEQFDPDISPRVIHTKRLEIKPMTVDEAVTQMDLIDHEFLVFKNDSTQRMNVIYRRRDGNYGLIDFEGI